MARAFHDAGYATGHFGKWHLGGGRDVGYAVGTTAGTNAVAPRVVEYGFDQAWTQMEGLGNRIINVDCLTAAMRTARPRGRALLQRLESGKVKPAAPAAARTSLSISSGNSTPTSWPTVPFNSSMSRAAANPNKPFFLNYWPDEVHTVNDPPAVYKAKYELSIQTCPPTSGTIWRAWSTSTPRLAASSITSINLDLATIH